MFCSYFEGITFHFRFGVAVAAPPIGHCCRLSKSTLQRAFSGSRGVCVCDQRRFRTGGSPKRAACSANDNRRAPDDASLTTWRWDADICCRQRCTSPRIQPRAAAAFVSITCILKLGHRKPNARFVMKLRSAVRSPPLRRTLCSCMIHSPVSTRRYRCSNARSEASSV